MAHVINLDAVTLVEIFLEWQDDQHLLDVAFDRVDAIAAPGPDLRADVISHSVAVAVELLGQAQVELRPINQNDQSWPAFVRCVAQTAKGS